METFDDITNSLPPPADHSQRSASTPGLAALLRGWWIRVEVADGHRPDTRTAATVCGPGVSTICRSLSRMAAHPQWIVDGSICPGMDTLGERLRRQWPPRRLLLVDGVLESADVEAVQKAMAHDESPLAVEVRALADVQVGADGIRVETVDPEAIDMLSAMLLRGHVARCLQRSVSSITEPSLDIVMQARGGSDLLLRPIETDVMASSVDVGLGRTANNPARDSIVFDRLTGAWHMD